MGQGRARLGRAVRQGSARQGTARQGKAGQSRAEPGGGSFDRFEQPRMVGKL